VSREASRAGSGVRPRFSTWTGPLSIAAVLVLGIGISLRMQLEQPGIETSAPSSSSAEYPVPDAEPASPEPPPAAQERPPKQEERAREAKAVEKAKPQAMPQAKRIETPARADVAPRQAASESNPFADAPVAMQHAPVAGGPSTTLGATAPAAPPAPAPSRAETERAPATAESARAAAPAAGSIAPQAAAPRAKRQGFATDSTATRETRAIAAVADPDPDRELERIARLREAGRHADADRALEELRRRHPDLRIPEPVWERVRPR
jgi:hypothetical protein